MKNRKRYWSISHDASRTLEGEKWSTKLAYHMLCCAEDRFCAKGNDWFFRTDEDLAKDMGVSRITAIRAVKRLQEIPLIEKRKSHVVVNHKGTKARMSMARYGHYRILD